MVVGPDFSRGARADETAEIAELLIAAFGRPDEAELVRRLRADGDIWIEVVKPWHGVIAGYAALSRMRAPAGWAALAPVAVLPRFQRGAAAPATALRHAYAIGTRLVGEIVESIISLPLPGFRSIDFPSTVVVLGDPGFYERAGFNLARARNLASPYPISHTLIAGAGTDAPCEVLVYPTAFAELG